MGAASDHAVQRRMLLQVLQKSKMELEEQDCGSCCITLLLSEPSRAGRTDKQPQITDPVPEASLPALRPLVDHLVDSGFVLPPAKAVTVWSGCSQLDVCMARRAVWVVLVCLAFLITGPALTVLNKEIMQRLRFDYPLSLSSLGVLSAAAVTRPMVWCGILRLRPEAEQSIAGTAWFKTALPIGLTKAVTFAAGNAVYLYLGLGFIHMLMAFAPAIVVVVMKLFGMPCPSRAALWCIVLIVVGGFILCRGELHFCVFGVSLMLTSEVADAINLVMTQRLLHNCTFTTAEGLYVLSPPAAACLCLLAGLLEWPKIIESGGYTIILEHPWAFITACLLGIFVNFLSFEVVQATSSLTLKVLNVVRCVGLVLAGALFYNEVVTVQSVVGYSISLVGLLGYNWTQLDPEGSDHAEERMRECCCGGIKAEGEGGSHSEAWGGGRQLAGRKQGSSASLASSIR